MIHLGILRLFEAQKLQFWAEETVTIFCPSLVISHQFLTISALENNNWASVLGPFKGLFLPMALQNHMTAGSDERLTFSFGTHTRTQSCSGITSCETPLELYQTDWTCIKGCDFTHHTLAYIMTMFPAACSVTSPPPHLASSSHFTLCGTTRLSPPTSLFPFLFACWFLHSLQWWVGWCGTHRGCKSSSFSLYSSARFCWSCIWVQFHSQAFSSGGWWNDFQKVYSNVSFTNDWCRGHVKLSFFYLPKMERRIMVDVISCVSLTKPW